MPWLSLALLLGSVTVQYFPVLPAWHQLLAIILLLTCGVKFTISKLLLAFTVGVAWTSWHVAEKLQVELPSAWQGQTLTAQGYITDITQQHDDYLQFTLAGEQLSLGNTVLGFPAAIKLSWYNRERPYLHIGERWQFSVRIKQPHGFYNQGGFDYERSTLLQNVRAVGYVVHKAHYERLADVKGYYLTRLRHYLGEEIAKKLSGSKLLGFIQALSLGLRHHIDDNQWEVLQRTGTSHLMAISGLHIGLVAGLVYGLISWCWRRSSWLMLKIPAPIASAWAGIIAAVIYSALAGFAIPTQRALTMIIIVMSAVIARRTVMSWYVLAFAAVVVLLIDPFASWSMGFWLSFGAVAVIYFAIQGRLSLQTLWDKVGRTQWVVFVGLMPLTLAFFGQFSLISPFINAIAVPWAGFIVVPLSLIGTLFIPFSSWLAEYLLIAADYSLRGLWWLMATSSQWPFAVMELTISRTWIIGLALLGIIILLMPRGMPARYTGFILLLPLYFWQEDSPKVGEFWFTLLDVGQGLSAVVRTANHVLVYDTGDFFSPGFDAGSSVIVPYLKYQGISKVDMLMLSHQNSDHTGGARSLMDKIGVQQLITSFPYNYKNHTALFCKAGQRWVWDNVEFAVLHPQKLEKDANNNSCVLQVKTRDNQLLLTGDIEKRAEQSLVARWGKALRSTVLVAPHHGSMTSSTPTFIAAVAPSYVLYPVGYLNRFGFPKAAIWQRYRQWQAMQLQTDKTGSLTFIFPQVGGVLPPRAYREEERRFWH